MKFYFISLFLCLSLSLAGNTYYVSTSGSDSNPGTITQPWATLQKAVTMAYPGDIVYIRGGVYKPATHIGYSGAVGMVIRPKDNIGRSGTPGNPISYIAYPPDYESGNFPIIDGSLLTSVDGWNQGIIIEFAQYIVIKGLTVRNIKQGPQFLVNGVPAQCWAIGYTASGCANMTFENCTSHDIQGRGYWYDSGAWNIWDGPNAPFTSDTTRFINCDAYNLYDALSTSPGNSADGWKCGNYVRGVLYITGCRAWNYSDDAIDPGGAGKKFITSCWMMSTTKYDISTTWPMEGGGLKTGGFGDDQTGHYDPNGRYVVVKNCIAAYCKGYGFYNNLEADAQNNAQYLNNIAYRCYSGFSDIFRPVTRTTEYRNNISIYSTSKQSGYDPLYEVAIYYPSSYPASNNNWLGTNSTTDWPGWKYNPAVSVTDADFVSVDANELTTPRKSDGSLPDINFLRLAAGSDLIDAGVDVGLPYYGSAPDMGYSEYTAGAVVAPSPLYISSVIENATPARLDITYSLTLANIVPAASAFTVIVNSVPRTVTGVTISGTRVLLTLSSPIVYGDVVTVAYTKPATNPLQTAAGGQAATISAQNVTYNVSSFVYVSSVIENATPSRLEMTYNSALANSVPAPSDFTVMVNLAARNVTAVAISGTKVLLTLSTPVVYGNTVTVAYKKPVSNWLQSSAGVPAASISAQPVTNNCIPLSGNKLPVVSISDPLTGSTFMALATVNISASASDADGTISKVEFFEGVNKLAERTSAPWSYTWEYVKAGTYSIKAIATDNLSASTVSLPVEIIIDHNPLLEGYTKISGLYPNPNDGHFAISFTEPPQIENSEISVITLDGKSIYKESLSAVETYKLIDLPLLKPGIYILVFSANGIIIDTRIFIRE